MKSPPVIGILTLLLLAGTAAAQPQAAPPRRPAAFDALVQCRAVRDDDARLRCFDAAASALEEAAERRDVVIVDRAQVRESRRRLFGLAVPRLPIFGGGNGNDQEDEEEIRSIESPVARAYQAGSGRWVVTLEDGSTWAQVDNNPIASRPRRGDVVRVQRAALGTFMMRVAGQPAVRVRRQM